jgi:hypothetical protein
MTDEEFEGLARLLDATVRIKKFPYSEEYGYQVKINGHTEEDFGFNTHREAFENAKETFERLLKRPHANN